MAAAETVVIGLGNVILSDDGLGVRAVQRLRDRGLSCEGVELVEGGTAGLLLLPHLEDATRAILVDAIDAGLAPGALTRIQGEDWTSAFSPRMTPHEVALEDVLHAARLRAAWPDELVLFGLQPGLIALGTELSPSVAAALDGLVDAIVAQLAAWDAAADGRCTSSR
jgi:hydrogenase maturation protease